MPRRIRDYIYKAFNIGRSKYYPGLKRISSYQGPYSPYFSNTRQTSITPKSSQEYRPPNFTPDPDPNYVPNEYDVFMAPTPDHNEPSPKTHMREHELEMLTERLCELHGILDDMGCTADMLLINVRPRLREEFLEVMRERGRIAHDLAELTVDIREVEKAIEEQKEVHNIDEPSSIMDMVEERGYEVGFEGIDTLENELSPGMVPRYEGMGNVDMVEFSPLPSGDGNMTDENTIEGTVQQQGNPQEMEECLMDWSYEGNNVQDALSPQEQTQGQTNQQETVGYSMGWQEEIQDAFGVSDQAQNYAPQQEMEDREREELPQPGPQDLPGGLESLF